MSEPLTHRLQGIEHAALSAAARVPSAMSFAEWGLILELLLRHTSGVVGRDGSEVMTSAGGGPGPADDVPSAGGGRKDDDLTRLLRSAQQGDRDAEMRLYEVVYDVLRARGRGLLGRSLRRHSLSPTDLVSELYLRFARTSAEWKDRLHFYAAASRAMRHILVDHARTKRRVKRGGDARRENLDEVMLWFEENRIDVLDLDEALDELAREHAECARIVELKFFGGMSTADIAQMTAQCTRTVERDWAFARAWLKKRMAG